MDSLVARREIASGGADHSVLRAFGRNDFYFGADCVAIALGSFELQSDPMILCMIPIHQHVEGTVVRGYDSIGAAVVVNVADGQASADPRFLKNATRLRGNIH